MHESRNLLGLALSAVMSFLPLAQAQAQAQAQEGEGRLIGAWMYTCSDGPCRAFIGVKEGETSRLVLSMQKDRDSGRTLLAVHTPLGTILPPGIRVYTGSDQYLTLQSQICFKDGCDALAFIDDEVQRRMDQVSVARVAFFLQADRNAQPEGREFEVPVHGFSEALTALQNDPN